MLRYLVVVVLLTAIFGLATAHASAVSTAQQQLAEPKLHLLNDFPEAKCIDGTPAAYYHAAGSNADAWLIFFQGGGICTGLEDCYTRSKTSLGSSSNDPPTLPLHAVNGPAQRNCTINPEFCNFNLIWVQYCDGVVYSGSLVGHQTYNNTKLYFRGSYIREAVVEHAAKTFPTFKAATTVLISGSSAGALATFLHSDQMADHLRSLLPNVKKIRALPLSGFFLSHTNVDYQAVFASAMHIFHTANATVDLSPRCVKRFDPARQGYCAMAEFAFAASEVPTFVVNSQTDRFQMLCELFSKPAPDNGFTCAPSAGHAMKNECFDTTPFAKHPFQNCTLEQMRPIISYQTDFINRVSEVAGFQRAGSGAFISSCVTHGEALYPGFWTSYTINNTTMRDAISKWWNDDNPSTSALSHRYIDCQRSVANPPDYSCNSGCSTIDPYAGVSNAEDVAQGVGEEIDANFVW